MWQNSECRMILDELPLMICHFLPSSEIIYVNKVYCKCVNKKGKDLVGNSFLELIPADSRDYVWNNILSLSDKNSTLTHEHEVKVGASDVVWHKWTNRAIFSSEGVLVGYISVGEDITANKVVETKVAEANSLLRAAKDRAEKRENELRMLNIMKDKFFLLLAHDLRSPFNAILGFIEILKRKHQTCNNAERDSIIDIISASAQSAYELVDDLLIWARSQLGVLDLVRTECNLNEIVDSVIVGISGAAIKKNINISVSVVNERIFIDRYMLSSVLRNLISNGIKFTNRVDVSLFQQRFMLILNLFYFLFQTMGWGFLRKGFLICLV